MNLKELINEVGRLKELSRYKELDKIGEIETKLLGIKQTVEAVDDILSPHGLYEDWQKLKKLLGVK